MGTPLLGLTPPPGYTPATLTRSNALDDAAELGFADSVARYFHADWKREQHAEPTCHATIRHISIGWPSALPPNFLACYPSLKRPSLSDIQELAGKGRLHTTDDDISSYSSVTRHSHQQALTNPTVWGELLAC